MRHSIFIMFVVLGWVCLGQSKKEQIEILSTRLDSLNQILSSERNINSTKIDDLNIIIYSLEKNISQLNDKISKLEQELSGSKTISQKLQNDLSLKQKEINNLQVHLNSILDSISIHNYKSVQIGDQIWMKENLNVVSFRNGDIIPEAKTKEDWIKAGELGKPVWCFYENNAQQGEKFGRLYNWYAANDPRGIAPPGWHIPTLEDWNNFILVVENHYVGQVYDHIMQYQSGTSLDNKTGFSGLEAGIRNFEGEFNKGVMWWGSNEYVFYWPDMNVVVNTVDPCPGGCYFDPSEGFSVRCIKD